MQSTPSIYHPPARRNCSSLIGGDLLRAFTGLRCWLPKTLACRVRTCLRHSHTCHKRTCLRHSHVLAVYAYLCDIQGGCACTGWQWRPYHQQNLHGKVRILVKVSPTHCQPAHVLPLDAHLCDIRTYLRYTHIFTIYAHLCDIRTSFTSV
jgi:hypothetical protein